MKTSPWVDFVLRVSFILQDVGSWLDKKGRRLEEWIAPHPFKRALSLAKTSFLHRDVVLYLADHGKSAHVAVEMAFPDSQAVVRVIKEFEALGIIERELQHVGVSAVTRLGLTPRGQFVAGDLRDGR